MDKTPQQPIVVKTLYVWSMAESHDPAYNLKERFSSHDKALLHAGSWQFH